MNIKSFTNVCVMHRDRLKELQNEWILSVHSSSFPLTAVTRSTSRLWASTVSPPRWSSPPAPRNPELLPRLTQLLTGHTTHPSAPHLLQGLKRPGSGLDSETLHSNLEPWTCLKQLRLTGKMWWFTGTFHWWRVVRLENVRSSELLRRHLTEYF